MIKATPAPHNQTDCNYVVPTDGAEYDTNHCQTSRRLAHKQEMLLTLSSVSNFTKIWPLQTYSLNIKIIRFTRNVFISIANNITEWRVPHFQLVPI